MSAPTIEEVLARAERMVGRKVADDFLLIPIVGRGADADGIFDLNRVGTFIWEQFDGRRDGRRIVAALVKQFDVDHARAEIDYLDFAGKLLSVGASIRASTFPECGISNGSETTVNRSESASGESAGSLAGSERSWRIW